MPEDVERLDPLFVEPGCLRDLAGAFGEDLGDLSSISQGQIQIGVPLQPLPDSVVRDAQVSGDPTLSMTGDLCQ